MLQNRARRAAIFAAQRRRTLAHAGPASAQNKVSLIEPSRRRSRLEQAGATSGPFQNGCSASFLVEGGFDSHAPPPAKCNLKNSTRVLISEVPSSLPGHPNRAVFRDLLPICCQIVVKTGGRPERVFEVGTARVTASAAHNRFAPAPTCFQALLARHLLALGGFVELLI